VQVPGEKVDADVAIAASIGIAICPDDATDRHALLSHADTALYRAKNEGRATFRYFEAAMGAVVGAMYKWHWLCKVEMTPRGRS